MTHAGNSKMFHGFNNEDGILTYSKRIPWTNFGYFMAQKDYKLFVISSAHFLTVHDIHVPT